MQNVIPWDRKLKLFETSTILLKKKIGLYGIIPFWNASCTPTKNANICTRIYILILQHMLLHLFTGPFGGMRAAMALRAITGELGCLSVSNIFGIPTVQNAFDEEGNPQNDHMESGAKKMLDQLEWMATAMKNHREKVGVPS